MNEGDAGNSNTVFYKQIDAAGNESDVSSYGFDYDATDPSVSGLTSPSGTDTDGDVTFTLTFSEPMDVSTVEETDLTIAGGTIGSVDPINEIAGAATSFTVTASGEGDVGSSLDLAVAVGASFADRAGNSITLTTEVTDTAAIDTVHPTISSIAAAGDGAFTVGDSIDFTVTLSEDVQAEGALRLTLNTGETVTVATSAAGDTLTGTYTVTDSATDVADLAVTAIGLGSATDTNVPTDIAGNAMEPVVFAAAETDNIVSPTNRDTEEGRGFDIHPLPEIPGDYAANGGTPPDFTLNLRSTNPDGPGRTPFLEVRDSEGNWIADNDDGGYSGKNGAGTRL